MKTPNDIKNGLKYAETNCLYVECCEDICPYNKDCDVSDPDIMTEIPRAIVADALAYIQQLERERDEMAEELHGRCEVCAYYNSMSDKCAYCKHNADAWNGCEDNWEWRGVKESCTGASDGCTGASMMDKVSHHCNICGSLSALYEKKNADYGDSFGKSFKEYGLTMTCIRLEDKLNRLKALTKNKAQVEDESITDTLMDLANYAIMTIIELEGE